MPQLVPTCLWRISDELVAALDAKFGDPVDAYVNGSQVWLRDDGPADIPLEWRLHPVAGYQKPETITTHYEVFPTISLSVSRGATPVARPETLWDGLEAFPAYGDEVEPQPLADAVTKALGLAPEAVGLCDHDAVADAWERSGGKLSIMQALFDELASRPGS